MKHLFSFLVLFCLAGPALHARTWTDAKGRTIEADMVSADATSVEVMMAGGRQFKLPLAGLSADDQAYVKEWLENQSKEAEENGDDFTSTPRNDDNDQGGGNGGGNAPKPAPKPKPGQMTFDGQPLITGGKVNKYEYPYNEERLKKIKTKFKKEDTGFKIAIAVPHGFDPSKPQKVFIPRTAVNNAKQGLAGNFGVVGFYAKKCTENGWVCITYDSNLGQNGHNSDLYSAMEKLNEVWPEFKNWEFASGGFSGGAKACWDTIGYLLANDYKVIGAMLSGVNQDLSEYYRKRYKAPKTPYKDIKIHLSNGRWDDVADGSKQEMMEKIYKKEGMRKIKKTFHDGKHNLEVNQIPIALEFFTSNDDD